MTAILPVYTQVRVLPGNGRFSGHVGMILDVERGRRQVEFTYDRNGRSCKKRLRWFEMNALVAVNESS